MAELYTAVPKTWGAPTMATKCADEIKYQVSERFTKAIEAFQGQRGRHRRSADPRCHHGERRARRQC
jgi:hypothetical protein